jgi:hypothetical protein
MVILESLIVEWHEGILKQILEILPHSRLEDYTFPVYRVELDADLVLYLYQFTDNKPYYESIYQNILPHLNNCIVLAKSEVLHKGQFDENILQKIDELPQDTPIVIAAIPDWENEFKYNEKSLSGGLTLGSSHRLFFCDFTSSDQIKQLLKQIWLSPVSSTSQKGIALSAK